MPIFKRDGRLHSKQFINFIISLIIIVQCWRDFINRSNTGSFRAALSMIVSLCFNINSLFYAT
jgi:hypothetical protein